MPQFEISTYYSQIFWLIIVFSSLYLIISKLVSPNLEAIFKNRKIVINDAVEQAESLTLATEALKKEFDNHYKNILNAAEDIKKESAINFNKVFDEKKILLLKELEKKQEKTMEELNMKLESFLSSQSEACMDLAQFIIQKVTNKTANLALLESCYERVK